MARQKFYLLIQHRTCSVPGRNISPLSTNTSALVEYSVLGTGNISSRNQMSLRTCGSQFHPLVPLFMSDTTPCISCWLRVSMHPRGQYPKYATVTS